MPANESDWVKARSAMVQRQLKPRGITEPQVLAAMGSVPRHRFVPDHLKDRAYADSAMPTFNGQTISQPYMVAEMTQFLRVEPEMKVLEIGTGSGYQTAVLLALGTCVHTVERDAELSRFAAENLAAIGCDDRVTFHVCDGSLGCPEAAPFDRVLVTAAAPHLPAAYRKQLADPGRIVIPEGLQRHRQTLKAYDLAEGEWTTSDSFACVFVPLVGEDAWEQ